MTAFSTIKSLPASLCREAKLLQNDLAACDYSGDFLLLFDCPQRSEEMYDSLWRLFASKPRKQPEHYWSGWNPRGFGPIKGPHDWVWYTRSPREAQRLFEQKLERIDRYLDRVARLSEALPEWFEDQCFAADRRLRPFYLVVSLFHRGADPRICPEWSCTADCSGKGLKNPKYYGALLGFDDPALVWTIVPGVSFRTSLERKNGSGTLQRFRTAVSYGDLIALKERCKKLRDKQPLFKSPQNKDAERYLVNWLRKWNPEKQPRALVFRDIRQQMFYVFEVVRARLRSLRERLPTGARFKHDKLRDLVCWIAEVGAAPKAPNELPALAEELERDRQSTNDKLVLLDAKLTLPDDIKGSDLARLLGCDKGTIYRTKWWENRTRTMESRAGERQAALACRGRKARHGQQGSALGPEDFQGGIHVQ